jgi:PAS domain S-box-containing protein
MVMIDQSTAAAHDGMVPFTVSDRPPGTVQGRAWAPVAASRLAASRTPAGPHRHRQAEGEAPVYVTPSASPSHLEAIGMKSMTEAVFASVGNRNQREVLRSFFDRSGMCMAKLDSNIRLIEANADFSRRFGCQPAELDGSRFCDLLQQDGRAKVSMQFTHLLAQQQHPRFTEPMISFHQKDSTIFSGELTGFAVHGDGGRIDSLMALICPEDGSRTGRPPASRRLLLTDLEARILEGVAAGVSTVRLASNLYLSRGGIEYHVNILLRRLKVNNRPALISKAYSMSLLCRGWPPRVNPDYLK